VLFLGGGLKMRTRQSRAKSQIWTSNILIVFGSIYVSGKSFSLLLTVFCYNFEPGSSIILKRLCQVSRKRQVYKCPRKRRDAKQNCENIVTVLLRKSLVVGL